MKNIARNASAGLINRIIQLVFGFIIRTIIMHELGVGYLGLSSLFISILQMLSVAEMGFGSAIVFSMYKPIAEKDQNQICSLLKLYRKFYRIVGIVILIIGISILPILNKLINGTYPEDINIYLLYLLYLINTTFGYFLFSYKASVFIANQRDDIRCNINSLVYLGMYIGQILLLVLTRNYYWYIILLPICTVVVNIYLEVISRRMYPEYICMGTLDKSSKLKLIKQVIGLMSYQIGGVIFNNADTIVISAFLGLTVLARYSNYYYIIYGLVAILNILTNAMTASIGNSIVTESREKNANQFNLLGNVFNWITGWCSICLMCMFQPFIAVWMGKENLLSIDSIFLFSTYFYFWNFNLAVPLYKKAAGIWWEDKIRHLIGIAVNVILNIWLVQIIGINGVVISSIISTMFISIPWSTYFLFKCYLKLSLWKYIFKQSVLFVVSFGIGCLTYLLCKICNNGYSIEGLLISGMICLIIPNILFLIYFKVTGEWKEMYMYLLSLKKVIMKG